MAEQYNQDFYQSGYNLDEALQPEQQAPMAGWQASTAPAQGQRSGGGQQTCSIIIIIIMALLTKWLLEAYCTLQTTHIYSHNKNLEH